MITGPTPPVTLKAIYSCVKIVTNSVYLLSLHTQPQHQLWSSKVSWTKSVITISWLAPIHHWSWVNHYSLVKSTVVNFFGKDAVLNAKIAHWLMPSVFSTYQNPRRSEESSDITGRYPILLLWRRQANMVTFQTSVQLTDSEFHFLIVSRCINSTSAISCSLSVRSAPMHELQQQVNNIKDTARNKPFQAPEKYIAAVIDTALHQHHSIHQYLFALL